MRANRSRDTGPELAIRRRLFTAGLRYRVDTAPVPGFRRRADIVFPKERIAVLVHGCFWHGCESHRVAPKRNADFWDSKVEANRARDADTVRRWVSEGWKVIVVWEHDDPGDAAARIASVVHESRRGS